MGIRIAGTGSYLPERIRTNADIEKLVDTNDEWIRTRTGVEERRIAGPGETASTMGIRAAEKALAEAGVDGRDIDAIVVATISPDYIFPNTAALIQNHFRCKQAFCFDLSAACAGFVSSLEVGFSLMRSFPNKYRNVLVCGSDKLSVIVDWTDRNTCILFGSRTTTRTPRTASSRVRSTRTAATPTSCGSRRAAAKPRPATKRSGTGSISSTWRDARRSSSP